MRDRREAGRRADGGRSFSARTGQARGLAPICHASAGVAWDALRRIVRRCRYRSAGSPCSLTLARLVRAQLPGLSIVLTTGVYDQIESVISVGVVPLLKPFTREQLEAVFEEQLCLLLPLQPAPDRPHSTM